LVEDETKPGDQQQPEEHLSSAKLLTEAFSPTPHEAQARGLAKKTGEPHQLQGDPVLLPGLKRSS
jgi:hypothetical protein